ncbi:ABC transporter C family member 10 [Lasiodiplodia hormozganensis]|uniref:ABC transporter C family member 10 n=1 Tax=Lasiodiplodia hormozganensis TaxID=869390 RepID=A0AA40CL58_9PEZI|nr:ABC transporter C family member 10 [Lasiodiplodia hormozganensis]
MQFSQALVAFQALRFVRENSSSRRRYRLGLLLAGSCIALLIGVAFTNYFSVEASTVFRLVSGAELVAGAVVAVGGVSVPRQQASTESIDAQNSVSALSKHTFSWVRPLLDHARAQGTLEYADLPSLASDVRTGHLHARFHRSSSTPLWRLVIADHRASFIVQWALTGVESFLLVGPQFCLFQLLKLLERKGTESVDQRHLWLWAAALIVLKITHLFCESWIEWVNFAMLATPIRSQLSALIFTKSMRLKDIRTVKHASVTAKKRSSEDGDSGIGDVEEEAREMETLMTEEERDAAQSDDKDEEEVEEDSSQAAQGAINLLGVDVQRVSDFAGYNVLIPGSLLKIIIAACFLVNLIGWVSTIVGLSVPIIFQPLNQVATRGYSNAAEAVMMIRDEKTHVVTEALHGIRQIKFSAIEGQWQKVIMDTRKRELGAQWRLFKWGTFMTFTWLSMPILLGAAALGTYAWLNGSVTASVAFTALSVFTSLEWTLSVVPTTITELIDAKVSITRIQQHLDQPNERGDAKSGDEVIFKNASVRWPSESIDSAAFTLRDLNLHFPSNQLSVIHGKTGSGKSLLLAAILGEADVVKGTVTAPRSESSLGRRDDLATLSNWIIPSSVAFVSQIPWIENASLKNNILFGLPFISTRYRKVLDACALTKDLEVLPDGEETEIGASGINLSGGQRWRVTLARALYSRAGVLVLDDIFSAVDTHVGQHILVNALHGDLVEGRTRILVTHHIGLVSSLASYIVELDGDGFLRSASHHRPALQHFNNISSKNISDGSDGLQVVELEGAKPPPKKFVEEEVREKGRVKFDVYKGYMGASGGVSYWTLTIGLYVLSALSILGRSYWIKHWTQQTSSRPPDEDPGSELKFYLGVYLGISTFAACTIAIKTLTVMRAAIRASHALFEKITYTVLHAPPRWLDTVPVGRIMNRFVGDFALVDSRLGGDFNWSFHGILTIMTIIGAALFVSGYMILPIVLFAMVSLYYTNVYLEGARDIKRLESNAKSPIFELLGSALAGLATIRSFGKADEYAERMFARIDDYGKSTWNLLLATRWMAFRHGLFGSVFTFLVAVTVILLDGISASLAGFTLGFALEYSNIAIQTIGRYTGFELDMNSAERVIEYTKLKTEDLSGESAPQDWPTEGRLEVKNLAVSYAPDLPLVLKGLSFTAEARQRIGVVGRTGSGKSSLTLALFRFLQAREGRILIDGTDISRIRLQDLRSRLAIIPQDPVLFSGTLRSNLDPFDDHSDAELLDALRRVHLLGDYDDGAGATANINVFRDLQSPVARGGLNLSQGQRQLLCLARAVVRRPRLMVLDEATSAVDMQTDALIQRSIREDFADCTLLVIAHRLSTVADFDKVLVMDQGRAVEFDAPATLLRSGRGAFSDMVAKSGEKDAIEKLLLG